MKFFRPTRYIKNKIIREWVEALFIAFIAAFIIRSWLYAPFRVPTGSMIPTIYIGDQLLADMSAYGYYIPFTNTRIFSKNIERGDIVIFPNPENPEICDSAIFSAISTVSSLFISIFNKNYVPTCVDFIKRVVAIGGDKIEINGEKVYINNEPEKNYSPFYNPYLPQRNVYQNDIVPKDSVFVMGDNRRDSHDGRFWQLNGNGPSYVKMDKVRAKGKWIYFSSDPELSIFQGSIRWSRMFSTIK